MKRLLAAAVPAALLLAACVTPQVAVNPRADFSKIHRVAVVTFGGPQGDVAADLLTQSLVAYGANVVERQQLSAVLQEQHLGSSGVLDPSTLAQLGRILGVDAIFVGTVAQSMPEQSYMVTTPDQAVVNTVTPVSSGSVYAGGPVMGVPNSQVVTTAAAVSIVGRLVDVTTGSVLWSASMSYEGYDVPSAMRGVTDAFVQSLVPIWPELIAKK
ncbi:MAG: hypothetical protein KGL53_09405 [Elusimicrobia bacterium]|nr:hypothetical protein [Elusimicrobiota bacterium]